MQIGEYLGKEIQYKGGFCVQVGAEHAVRLRASSVPTAYGALCVSRVCKFRSVDMKLVLLMCFFVLLLAPAEPQHVSCAR